MFTFCSNYVAYLSTKPLQKSCCHTGVEQNAFAKLLFLFTQLGQCFQIYEEVPLEIYRMFPVLTHTEIYVAWHQFSEMWSKVSFPFPDEGTVISMGAARGSSRAGTAWLGVFYWFMKDKQLLPLICFPTTEIHLMNSALELTQLSYDCVSQIALHVETLFAWGRESQSCSLCLSGSVKVVISLPNYFLP